MRTNTQNYIRLGATPIAENSLPLNCWVVPGYNSHTIVRDLQNQINGGYPYLDQTAFYIDPSGSSDWCTVARQRTYQDIRLSLSYSDVVEQIAHLFEINASTSPPIDEIDIVALGPGMALEECILAQLLAERFKYVRIFLIDVSDGLLQEALRNMTVAVQNYSNVEFCAVRGDFHQLWDYLPKLSPSKPNRKRLVMAFTILYNLQDELSFLHNNFIHFDEKDIFLFDFFKIVAPVEYPELIQQREVRLSGKKATAWDNALDDWHRHTLERYCLNLESVSFGYQLNTHGCLVSGSYSVDKIAQVKLKTKEERTLIMQRYKRYPPEQLVYMCQRQGWLPINAWSFSKLTQLSLYLFQKTKKY